MDWIDPVLDRLRCFCCVGFYMKLWLFRNLIALDQAVNALLYPLLNLAVKDGGAKFGHPDETLSGVFGKNMRLGTCAMCSWICRKILHPIDENHCIEAIESDRQG